MAHEALLDFSMNKKGGGENPLPQIQGENAIHSRVLDKTFRDAKCDNVRDRQLFVACGRRPRSGSEFAPVPEASAWERGVEARLKAVARRVGYSA
jgi:hypothetical protein